MYRIVNKKKLLATRIADFFGRLVFAPFGGGREPSPVDPEAVRSILVVRTAYIGDVVMTTPMLGPLRRRFPHARLSFLTSRASAEVLSGNPDVDEILTYDPFWFYPSSPKAAYVDYLRRFGGRRFDLVIEARGDIRELLLLVSPLRARYKVGYGVGGGAYLLSHVTPHPAVNHRVDYHLDIARFLGARVDLDNLRWGLRLAPEELDAAGALLRQAGASGDYCCLHPGSRLAFKRWDADKYAQVGDVLAREYGLTPVVLGAPDETAAAARVAAAMGAASINLAGRLGLRQMGAVLAGAKLFVCNDSAPMHIAAALGTPTVAVFGPSKSNETGPWSAKARVVELDFPCRRDCDETSCRFERTNACMREVDAQRVLASARELLGPSSAAGGSPGRNLREPR